MKSTLEKVTNVPMSPDVWKQATLPIAMGGLGLQKAADTALPAYVSSLISAMPTVESIVPASRLSDKVAELSARWSTETGKGPPSVEDQARQSSWTKMRHAQTSESLLETPT